MAPLLGTWPNVCLVFCEWGLDCVRLIERFSSALWLWRASNIHKYLMFIGLCIIAIVDEWKTNLMSLVILFHLLWTQHVSDINISIFSSLRLCWWFTTTVVLFSKDGWFSVNLNLRCVWCDVLCRLVVVGRCILIEFDRYLLCFVIIVFVCVW